MNLCQASFARQSIIMLLVACAALGGTACALADERSPANELPPSRITKSNYDRIQSRKGQISEAEVIAILGPPTLVRRPASSDGSQYNMVWEHRTMIEVQMKNDRVRRIAGAFSPYVPSKRVTLENLKRLHVGMTEDDVREILGTPTGADGVLGPRFHDEADVMAWSYERLISLDFKDDKVIGLLMVTPVLGSE